MAEQIDVKIGNFPGEGESLIFLLFADSLKKNRYLDLLDSKTKGYLKKQIVKTKFLAKEDECLGVVATPMYDEIILVGLGKVKDFNHLKLKNGIASAVRKLVSAKHKTAQLFYFSALGKNFFATGKNISLAYRLANYRFDKYKGDEEKKKTRSLEKLTINLQAKDAAKKPTIEKGMAVGEKIAEGICLVRDLVNEPASHVGPEEMVKKAKEIASGSKGRIEIKVLDEKNCREFGMGAFLGVAQGSEKEAKFIILHYKPGAKTKTKVCLIGKTITFDSGGLSLKPADYMMDMKIDMAGGATVLGVFKILASGHIDVDCEIYGILPACENMPSGKALRPGDIVTALNGKTIEVLNTDAEGRLALSDALSYAEKYLEPDYIIDLATLTGACMVALGKDISGMFGNDDKFLDELEGIAKKEGDELWKLPLYKPYLKKMKSDVADLKNIGGGRFGGAITAALFLAEFVKKSKWIHLDIAGPSYNDESEKGFIGKGGTGWGVVTVIEWLKKLV